MDKLERWLSPLGLEHLAPVLRANDVDFDILPELTEADLEKIGLSLGERKRLLKAAAGLSTPYSLQSATTPPNQGAVGSPERRQLTVMFCDLVGSTALAARADAEDVSEIMRAYQNAAAGEIARFEGHVAQFLGDGVLAYFGWPRAHEDDAERAVRAALAVVRAVAEIDAPTGGRLAARLGIATGVVVVGDLIGEGSARQEAVVGETPNLAARLQELAPRGGVVIAETTRRLLGDIFEFEALGVRALKGFDVAVPIYQVKGEGCRESRFEALHAGALAPLVGREQEMALLLERWLRAKSGEGQIVLLDGEPGVGKSRIVQALRERLSEEPYTPLSHYCSPYHANSPLYPVIGLLERAARIDREDTVETKLDKLEALLAQSTKDVHEAAPLLASLLALPTEQRYPPLTLTPERQKQRTLEVLVEQVAGLAEQRPVLALYEDAHWIDPSTLELLRILIERTQRLPLLVVITFRPEFQPPWTSHALVTRLSLSRLTRRHGTAIAMNVTGGKPLPPEVLDQILARTDGVPLFVEELTKAVVESGLLRDAGDRLELTGPLPPLAIPATLYDSLMARLDRFAPVKEVAQVAAAIGRDFSHDLLAAVVDLAADRLDHALGQLVASELVFQRGTTPQAAYSFKHALVQDAAYQSLVRSKRYRIHSKIAHALENHFPEIAETRPELLAHHFAEAGLTQPAISYLQRAGDRAVERSAYIEAISHLSKALELLQALPGDPGQMQCELDLRIALGSALMATRGYAALEVQDTYLRARELCRLIGETPQLFPVLHGLYRFYHVRGDLQSAREAAQQLLELAERINDPGAHVEAHRALGVTLFWSGDVPAALAHLEQGIRLYEVQRQRAHPAVYGTDAGVVCLSYSALALWYVGYTDQACSRSRQAVALAQDLCEHHSLALALVWAAWLDQFRRDPLAARARADEAVALCGDLGFPLWLSMGAILRGWAWAQERRCNEGCIEMRQGIADLRATGAGLWQPTFLALLADAYRAAGRRDDGLVVLEEAFAIVAKNGEHFYEAELHRLEGELLLTGDPSDPHGAEASFRKALEIARRQDARSLELRAATSFARLRLQQHQPADAHELLATVYGSFTEGFNSPDLQDAKALLAEMC